jgi:hypothetical protein
VKNVGILKIELNKMAKDFKLNILKFFSKRNLVEEWKNFHH